MIKIPGRIPIRIYPFFWLLVVIIGWINSFTVVGTIAWAIVIFFSVLIHEYGHALTAIAFGQTAHIELVGLGGVTLRHGPRLSLWKEFIIVLNGPLAGFLLFLLVYKLRPYIGKTSSEFINYIVLVTIYANLFWTVVNLLPVHPLDGGKLMSIILEAIFGMRGIRFAFFLSGLFSLGISLLFFLMQSILGGAFFLLLAFESYRAWRSSLVMSSHDQSDDFQKMLKKAEGEMREGNESEAVQLLEEIRNRTQEGVIYTKATEDLAQILEKQGNIEEAYQLLQPIVDQISPEVLKRMHQMAYQLKDFAATIDLGNRIYQVYPGYEIALTNALSYALLGEEKPSVGWLQRAISDGLPNLRAVLSRSEFNNIRSFSAFKELENRYL